MWPTLGLLESNPMPDTELAIVFGVSSLLLIGLALPLMQRRVRPNRFYGFRTPSTLKDEALWYEVNAKTGFDLLIVGIGLLVTTLAHLLGLISELAFVAIAIVWSQGGMLWAVLRGFSMIKRWTR